MSPGKRTRDQFESETDTDEDVQPTSQTLPEPEPQPKSADSLDYIFDQIDPNLLLAAARLRHDQWPDTVFESLNWLTQLCKFATSYHGAYALMEVGTVTSLIEAYFRCKAIENTSQSTLLLLLLSLCFRVKEAHHTARNHANFYAMLFSRVARPNLSQGCLTGLNTEYEFNKQQLEELVPLFYAVFVHPVLDYKVLANRDHYKECGLLPVSLELDNITLEALEEYRAHVETTVPRVKAVWRGIASQTHEIEPQLGILEAQLAQELGYAPTVSSFTINTVASIFCAPTNYRHVVFVSRRNILAFAMEQLDRCGSGSESGSGLGSAPPLVYRVLAHFFIMDQLPVPYQEALLPELWAAVSSFIQALLSEHETSTAFQQKTMYQMELLKLFTGRGTVADSVASSLFAFVHSTQAMNIQSTNIRFVWQLVADECIDLLEGLDLPQHVRQFLNRARFDDFPRRFPKPETGAS